MPLSVELTAKVVSTHAMTSLVRHTVVSSQAINCSCCGMVRIGSLPPACMVQSVSMPARTKTCTHRVIVLGLPWRMRAT